jgi:hypothetical protein
MNYNTSAVKIYSTTSSLEHFENKNTFLYICKNAQAYYNTGVVAVNSKIVGLALTIMNYNASAVKNYHASAVKIYSATNSLEHFENKNIFLYICKNALAYYNAGVVVDYSVFNKRRKIFFIFIIH